MTRYGTEVDLNISLSLGITCLLNFSCENDTKCEKICY